MIFFKRYSSTLNSVAPFPLWTKITVGLIGSGVIAADLYYFFNVYERPIVLNTEEYQFFPIQGISQINHDSFIIDIKTRILPLIKNQKIEVPCHVSVKDDSCQIARSYTPIKIDKNSIQLLVKRYPDGSISRMLTNLKVGDKIALRGLIPTFSYSSNTVQNLIMIAGGTGITPMYQLATSILNDEKDSTKITLLYANKTMEDILLKSELDTLALQHSERFNVTYKIESFEPGWDQERGRITSSDLESLPIESSAIIVCGPLGLIQTIAGPKLSEDDQGPLGGYLKELGFKDYQILKL